MDHWEVAVLHAFKGSRFEQGHLDVDVAVELAAYRELVIDVAKSLWTRENAGRQRLPKGFEQTFQLRITELSPGSTVVALSRNVAAGQQLHLMENDLFHRSMCLIEETVVCAASNQNVPAVFPRSTLPKFRRWGSSLFEDEQIELRSPNGQTMATYGAAARANLLDRIDTSYENTAEVVGYVLATSIRAGRFELYRDLHSGEGVVVPLVPEYEKRVLHALSQHDQVKLRVSGTGAFGTDGSLVRFTSVTRVEEQDRAVDNSSLWARLGALSRAVPESAWEVLPADAAENHDTYLQAGQ